jgi:hypothetical protein
MTGEYKKKRLDELGRFEITHNTNDIEILKSIYPMEKKDQ